MGSHLRGDLQFTGTGGLQPFTVRPDYKAYKSPHGPKYSIAPNYHGISTMRAFRFGLTSAAFAGVAGIFALFFFAEVPKVRDDIVTKIPVIGDHFRKEIAPEDNPF